MAGRFGRMAAQTLIGRLASRTGAVLFPHDCVACGLEGNVLCRECQELISAPLRGVFLCPVCGRGTPFGAVCSGGCRRTSALDGAAALAPYGHAVLRDLLHAYKYAGILEAGERLEEIWASWLRRARPFAAAIAGNSRIVPVPLHYFRLARRGFNQADRFADALGRAAGATVTRDILLRRFRWKAQAGIAAATERRANAGGSVRSRPGVKVGGRLVLVDDVLTTGSTAQECARVLKRAGAREVWAVTLLRG